MAYNSIVNKVGDGVTTEFNFSFTGGYMSTNDVKCQVGAEVDGTGAPVYRTITFVNAGRIRIGGAVPAVGEQIKIFRKTPINTAINDFKNGTVLDASTLDLGFEQLVKAAQELSDGVADAVSAKVSADAAKASELAADASKTAAETAKAGADTAKAGADAANVAAQAAKAYTEDRVIPTLAKLWTSSATYSVYSPGEILTVAGGKYVFEVAPHTQTSGTIATNSGLRLKPIPNAQGYVSPDQWKATGDGVVDDMAKIVSALASGYPVTGFGKEYGIAGVLTLNTGNHLYDMQFRQRTPSILNSVSIRSVNADNLTLEKIKVHRNGDGTTGLKYQHSVVNWELNNAYGIDIKGGSKHKFKDIEVEGYNSGTGVRFWAVNDAFIEGVYVHDMYCTRTTIADDVLSGIRLYQCKNTILYNCRVEDLATQEAGQARLNIHTRGIETSGCRDVYISHCLVRHVGQAYDLTGGEGNLRVFVSDCSARDIYTNGFKAANSAVDCVISRCTATRVGFNGFLVSGPSGAGLTYKSERVSFVDCKAEDVGSNNVYATTYAFRVERQTDDPNYPRQCSFRGCTAVDQQVTKTMDYGFHCEVISVAGDIPNMHSECYSLGHKTAAFHGFPDPAVTLVNTADWTHPGNGSWQGLGWNAEQGADPLHMHDNQSNNGLIHIRKAGIYRLEISLHWAANSNGSRYVAYDINSDGNYREVKIDPAPSQGELVQKAQWITVRLKEGDFLRGVYMQNHTAAVGVRKDYSFMRAVWLRD